MVPERPAGTLYAAYVLVFAAAAVACLGTLGRARRVEHDETRRGLVWLLLTAGGWAAANVGYLTAPTQHLQYTLYTAGLVVGWASVGPWLYFCSAYTGRAIHRNPTIRAAAVGVFLAITAVKVTNPLHGWYFAAEPATEPFPYLAVTHQPLHWIAMGLAYALALVGFFMLFELFVRVNTDTRPLLGLLALTGLPVVFDVLGAIRPKVLDITYSSVGVALFAVGAIVYYFDQFQFVRVTGDRDDPVIVADEAGRIRDYNRRAAGLFPSLSGAIGTRLEDRLPELDAALADDDAVFEVDGAEGTRYYNLSSSSFATGTTGTGRSIVLSDITQREEYQRELEAKNEQLERFASIVSHDLRNPLQVARGRTELAIEDGSLEHLDPVVRAHERMDQLIEEMLTLAREGVSIDETESVAVADVARQSWEMVAAGSASLVVEEGRTATVDADPERLQQLFENLFRNSVEHSSTGSRTGSDDSVEHTSTDNRTEPDDAVEHGGAGVTITVGALDGRDGFYVADDGPGIPPEDRERVFEPGYTTDAEGTGFGLAIVSEIVDGHGWEIGVVEGARGGARFEIRTG